MKCPLLCIAVSLAPFASGASAACTAETQVQGAATLRIVLEGNTMCASRGNDSWQEYHQAGGGLIDYKKGPSDKIDPTKQVGTWSVSGNGAGTQVRYDYGIGRNYNYKVHTIVAGSSYSMCSGSAEVVVTLRPGQGPC